ncbi:MAG: 1,4-dihydroxy-6-naphthoate synthase [Alistipes sp.]|nr:1,4-dihydroxy-6-naphthoate synthase [Alistipes sp.]
MKLRLNISPCPNDTFMFDALVNGRIDTRGLEFEVEYHDIERLNLLALDSRVDITKVSYAVLPLITDMYTLLDAGSALGRGNGPLLVSGGEVDTARPLRIAVPGLNTTANLLMERLYPGQRDKHEVLFSEIAEAVAAGRYDAGVLIHEGRFTYADKGLVQVGDLGLMWEERTGLPLPLGAIVASRSLPDETVRLAGELVRESVLYALGNPDASRRYVRSYARELDPTVIDSHISLFVNDFSVALGDIGRQAVAALTGIDPAGL